MMYSSANAREGLLARILDRVWFTLFAALRLIGLGICIALVVGFAVAAVTLHLGFFMGTLVFFLIGLGGITYYFRRREERDEAKRRHPAYAPGRVPPPMPRLPKQREPGEEGGHSWRQYFKQGGPL